MVFLVDHMALYLYNRSMLSNKNKGAKMSNPNTKVQYISVNDGKLELHVQMKIVCKSNDIKTLVACVLKHKLAHNVFCSPSFNFASEYGFAKNSDAQDIWIEVVREYNAIENKVYG